MQDSGVLNDPYEELRALAIDNGLLINVEASRYPSRTSLAVGDFLEGPGYRKLRYRNIIQGISRSEASDKFLVLDSYQGS